MLKFLSILFVVLACLTSIAHAGTTNVVTLPYKPDLRVYPFENLPYPNFNWVDGATVSIEFGYSPKFDRLFFDYNGNFPIEGTFNTQNGVLYLTGRATVSEYMTAISTVVFYTKADDGRRRKITWSLGTDTFYFSLTEHYYKYYESSGNSWQDAFTTCNGTKLFDMQGYLATVTSSDEQAELGSKATFSAWLGGNDIDDEGTWRWKAGPEGQEQSGKGRLFWSGMSMYAGGKTPLYGYAAWNRFQPNNGDDGTSEDFLCLVNSQHDQETSFWADAANTASMGGFICEFGGMDSKEIADTIPHYTGSTVLYVGCDLFQTKGECQNNAEIGCGWSSGKCHTISCRQYLTQAECARVDWRCDWNIEGFMGVCTNTQCSKYATTATCAMDTSCTPKTSSSVSRCSVAKCSDHRTACACSQNDGCAWRNQRCGYEGSLNCDGMDIIYILDGTSIMGQQWGRNDQGFLGLIEILMESQMFLTGTPAGKALSSDDFGSRVGFVSFGSRTIVSPSGTGTGGRLSGSHEEVMADLEYQLKQFNPASTGRSISGALNQIIQMFGPDDGRSRVAVILSAGKIDDASAIAAKYAADRKNGGALAYLKNINVKLVGAAIRPTDPETPDSVASAASLMDLVDTDDKGNSDMSRLTLRNIPDQLIYGLCSATSYFGPMVRSTFPNILCSRHATAIQCAGDPLCSWDSAAKACSNSNCLRHCSFDDCSADIACGFVNRQCLDICTAVPVNDTDCGVTMGVGACAFNYDAEICEMVPCMSNPTEDGCIADENACQFNPSQEPQCQPMPCFTNDGGACVNEPGCVWSGDSCFQDRCSLQKDKNSCAQLSQCSWNASKCTLNPCGLYQDEQTCQVDSRCTWHVETAPPACGPAPCTFFNFDPKSAESNCKAQNSTCLWQTKEENHLADMCIPKICELMKKSCDCAALPDCVWRNDQCKDSTYVQCPAIDVVFLVEASPIMLQTFGRHPNGYVGIVEAIRTWSKEAPFSATLESTGFRMALVNYKAENQALSTPSSVASGGNLTMDPNLWYGVNQALDWNEENMAEYATAGGPGTVAIKPALKKAIEIFQQSASAPSRKRLVVILGHSAITDGAKNLNTEITQLEAMGVNIFANIVRRYSYISPVEVTAADFMRPLASDPHTVHFLFTTIDNMKRTLLEKFCDPTTGTGQVLQISRDRELPCDWLVGADECNIQGSCAYNASALRKCPSPDQCPNMDCMALPETLRKSFDCIHCSYKSGAFRCSRGTPNKLKSGLCEKAKCSWSCQTDCEKDSQCFWNAASTRCERNMCTYTNMNDCNSDYGCVWSMDDPSKPKCQRSVCGRLRSTTSCTSLELKEELVPGASTLYEPCQMVATLTPPICKQMRCPQMDPDTCKAEASMCKFVPSLPGRKCEDKVCTYGTSEQCDMDTKCFWNPFDRQCYKRQPGCVLSGYSDWSPCSSTCGAATTYKTRSIVQFPSDVYGLKCDKVASKGCVNDDGSRVKNCDDENVPPDTSLAVIRSCTTPPEPTGKWIPPRHGNSAANGEWEMSCEKHCSFPKKTDCVADNSCQWRGGRCGVKPFIGCVTLNETECHASDMCAFDSIFQLCQPVMDVCPYDTSSECSQVGGCSWRTGSTVNYLARSQSLPAQLYNPGQDPIYPFYNLVIDSQDLINGASITIETNYQVGKDALDGTYGDSISFHWVEQSGTLKLHGSATVTEYANAIKGVTFTSTSTRTSPRRISWSFGNDTIYSTITKHHYRSVAQVGANYNFAKSWCSKRSLYGLKGYLATVTSAEENDLISVRALGTGWISGDDASNNIWQYSTGPEAGTQFWKGGSIWMGGGAVNNAFANWCPPNTSNINGEPVLHVDLSGSGGMDHPYLSPTGYWESRVEYNEFVDNFICEFGGSTNDIPPPYPIGGGMIVGVGGCVAQMCLWHTTRDHCEKDVECQWMDGMCQSGCASYSTETECSQSEYCKWDTNVEPAACDINKCFPLSVSACTADPQCTWDGDAGHCKYVDGCQRFQKLDCQEQKTCTWSGVTCKPRKCDSYLSLPDCRENPMCTWSNSESACTDAICMYSSKIQCLADPSSKCMWNDATSVSVGFPPGGATILVFETGVEPPSDITTHVDGITIMITEGFQRGFDILHVSPEDNIEQDYFITYDPDHGVMTLQVEPGRQINPLAAFTFMKKTVRFSSESTNPIRRRISYTLAMNSFYSVPTKSYIKWIPGKIASYEQASSICGSTKFFGLSGSIASIMHEQDNVLLKNLQANGLLSASSKSDFTFSWNLPGNNKLTFWTGRGALGKPMLNENSTEYYNQWAIGEPTQAPSYVYFTASGYWMTIPGTTPWDGVVCQYGLQQKSTVAISSVRNVVPSGCFVAPCVTLTEAFCKTEPMCKWTSDGTGTAQCVRDTSCLMGSTPDNCKILELCYWDYDVGMCRSSQPSSCTVKSTESACNELEGCEWNPEILSRVTSRGLGACILKGCTKHVAESPCTADSSCQWISQSSVCASRLCGYQNPNSCWRDSFCYWKRTPEMEQCIISPCIHAADATACNAMDSCQYNATQKQCNYVRCATTKGKDTCLNDTACIFTDLTCSKPDCAAPTEAACLKKKPLCYFSVEYKECRAAQCVSFTNLADCEQGQTILPKKPCIWQNNLCRQPTFAEQHAPVISDDTCQKEGNPIIWWLWIFLAVILILIGMIAHRLYLAYAKGKSFFEPTKKNYKYSPHQIYAQDLFDEAQGTAVESNLVR